MFFLESDFLRFVEKCFDLGLKKDRSGTREFRSVYRCHFLVGSTPDNGGGGGATAAQGGRKSPVEEGEESFSLLKQKLKKIKENWKFCFKKAIYSLCETTAYSAKRGSACHYPAQPGSAHKPTLTRFDHSSLTSDVASSYPFILHALISTVWSEYFDQIEFDSFDPFYSYFQIRIKSRLRSFWK